MSLVWPRMVTCFLARSSLTSPTPSGANWNTPVCSSILKAKTRRIRSSGSNRLPAVVTRESRSSTCNRSTRLRPCTTKPTNSVVVLFGAVSEFGSGVATVVGDGWLGGGTCRRSRRRRVRRIGPGRLRGAMRQALRRGYWRRGYPGPQGSPGRQMGAVLRSLEASSRCCRMLFPDSSGGVLPCGPRGFRGWTTRRRKGPNRWSQTVARAGQPAPHYRTTNAE